MYLSLFLSYKIYIFIMHDKDLSLDIILDKFSHFTIFTQSKTFFLVIEYFSLIFCSLIKFLFLMFVFIDFWVHCFF